MARACFVFLFAASLCAISLAAPVRSTRPALAATSAQGGINVEPSARPWRYVGANPDSWWCPGASTCTTSNPLARIDTEISLAQQLHVANVRLEIPWFLVEPARGSYDWSRADYIFNSASAHGIVIQPILVYTPSWDGGYNAFPQAADFQSFVTTFMSRYGTRINAIEMWNEPDGGQSLASNNPALYVQDILNPGYSAVKSVNPGVSVIEGGSINDSGVCCAWLSGVINAGGHFDIAAFHDYGGNYAQIASAYRSLVGGKPIWLGEYGVSDSTGSQQTSLIRAALTGTPGLAMAQFYTLRDESVYLCCPPAPYGESKLYGVVAADDVTKKSSFFAMQSLLGGTSPPPTAPPSPPPTAPPTPPPTDSPSAHPSPTVTGSPGSSHSPQGTGSPGASSSSTHSSGSTTGGSSQSGSASTSGGIRGSGVIAALVSSRSTTTKEWMLLASASALLLGLAAFGWALTRSTNVAALVGTRPRPPLFKPRSALNVGLALGGVVLCVIAALMLTQLFAPVR